MLPASGWMADARTIAFTVVSYFGTCEDGVAFCVMNVLGPLLVSNRLIPVGASSWWEAEIFYCRQKQLCQGSGMCDRTMLAIVMGSQSALCVCLWQW